MIDQQDGNAISNGINATATGALQVTLIGGELKRLAALGNRTDKDIEDLFQHEIMV